MSLIVYYPQRIGVVRACYRVLIVWGTLRGVVQTLPNILGCVLKDTKRDFTVEKYDQQMKV